MVMKSAGTRRPGRRLAARFIEPYSSGKADGSDKVTNNGIRAAADRSHLPNYPEATPRRGGLQLDSHFFNGSHADDKPARDWRFSVGLFLQENRSYRDRQPSGAGGP